MTETPDYGPKFPNLHLSKEEYAELIRQEAAEQNGCSWCRGNEHSTDPSCNCLDEDEPTTETARIIASMRADNAEALSSWSENVDDRVKFRGARMRRSGVIRVGGPRYPLTSPSARRDAITASTAKIREGADRVSEDADDHWHPAAIWATASNTQRSEAKAPRRAMSMAPRKGGVRDLDALMSFFRNPTSMAQAILGASLQEKPDNAELAEWFTERGLTCTPADLRPLTASLWNLGKSQAWTAARLGGRKSTGGRPRKLYDRYSACVYLDGMIARQKSDTAVDDVPGGNDVMQGPGHDAGTGWDRAWAEGAALSPAQVARRDAALDEYHESAARQAEETE